MSGLEFAKLALEELARRTRNECLAADRNTHQVVAQGLQFSLLPHAVKRIVSLSIHNFPQVLLGPRHLVQTQGVPTHPRISHRKPFRVETETASQSVFPLWSGSRPEKGTP